MRIGSLAISGIGLLSPAGSGERAFCDALAAARPVEPSADWLTDADPLTTTLPPALRRGARVVEPSAPHSRALQRLPRLSRLCIAAAREALAAAAPACDPTALGLVFASGLGPTADATRFVRSYLVEGAEAASPLLFSQATPAATAGHVAIECGLRGVSATIHHRDASPLSALACAASFLALERADAVVVVAADELTPATLHAQARFGALTAAAMRPYDGARDGFVAGELAVALLLERDEDARRRGAAIRARLVGVRESGDRRPRIGWGDGAASPAAAADLTELARTLERVDWIAGGGNGTALDEAELRTLALAFGATMPPLSSILAQTGESFSSAALRLCAAVWALEQQRLPATVGLTSPSSPWASALVREPRRASVERVLIPSLAQGGANVTVALARA